MGPPQRGQVRGSKSARWICPTGAGSGLDAGGGVIGIKLGEGGFFGSEGRVSS